MAEILTESFCERCGTRYTFESTARRPTPFGVLGTVGRGIRNFVAMPDASLDEAFAVARAETEQGATAHQLEAFHQTFNFCLSCRQYTCAECWNTVEGRCLSCAPLPEVEVAPEPAVSGEPFAVTPPAADAFLVTAGPSDLAWPTIELQQPAAAAAPPMPVAEPSPALDEWPVAEAEPVVEEWPVAEAAPVAELEPFAEADPEPPAAIAPVELEPVVEPEPVPDVEPEPSLEPTADPEPEAEPEPEFEAKLEPVVEIPPPAEDVAAASIGDPGVATGTPSPPPRASSRPAFEPGVSLDEQIAAYDLRMAALASARLPAEAAPPPQALVAAPIVVAPTRVLPPPVAFSPAPPTPRPVEHALGIPEVPPDTEDAASAAAPIGTCPSCGLTLSASARFCRRCGTQQRA